MHLTSPPITPPNNKNVNTFTAPTLPIPVNATIISPRTSRTHSRQHSRKNSSNLPIIPDFDLMYQTNTDVTGSNYNNDNLNVDNIEDITSPLSPRINNNNNNDNNNDYGSIEITILNTSPDVNTQEDPDNLHEPKLETLKKQLSPSKTHHKKSNSFNNQQQINYNMNNNNSDNLPENEQIENEFRLPFEKTLGEDIVVLKSVFKRKGEKKNNFLKNENAKKKKLIFIYFIKIFLF